MEKLDRLGWAAGCSLRLLDVRIGLRSTDAGSLPGLAEQLAPGLRPLDRGGVDRLYSVVRGGHAGRSRRYHLVYADALLIARTFDWNEAMDALQRDIEAFAAGACRNRVFVHAGVVSVGDKVIVIPGRSGSGKTTLVQAFIRAGARYFSDEYALIDARGWVHPYPRAPVVREASGTRRRARFEPDPLALDRPPLRLGLIAAAPYRPTKAFSVREVSPARGVFELMKNAPAARHRPAEILRALTRASTKARVVFGTRGEADAAVEALGRML